MPLANSTAKHIWLKGLLKDLGLFLSQPPILWCENIDATFLSVNPIFDALTKHVAIDFYFVCKQVTNCQLYVRFISRLDQLADVLTKPLLSKIKSST